jgi:hypothetical protein
VVVTLAIGFLAAFSKPRDWVHLMMVFPPMLLALAMLAERFWERAPSLVGRVTRIWIGLTIVAISAVSVAMMVDMRRVFDYPLGGPRGFIFADRLNGPLVAEVLEWQAETVAPGVPLPVLPTQPAIAFLAGRETAGGFHMIWPMQGGDRDATIIADIESRGVDHLLFSISQWGHLGSFGAMAPDLYRYLVENFEISRTFSLEPVGPIVAALERRGPVAASTPLAELAPNAFTQNAWPFGRVLHQPVESVAGARGIELRLRVPVEQPLLVLQAGLNPNRWFGAPVGPFDFRIERHTAAGWITLAHTRLDPRHEVRDRRWQPIAIDLSEQAGQETQLRFTILADGLYEEPTNLAGWREPAFYAEK